MAWQSIIEAFVKYITNFSLLFTNFSSLFLCFNTVLEPCLTHELAENDILAKKFVYEMPEYHLINRLKNTTKAYASKQENGRWVLIY